MTESNSAMSPSNGAGGKKKQSSAKKTTNATPISKFFHVISSSSAAASTAERCPSQSHNAAIPSSSAAPSPAPTMAMNSHEQPETSPMKASQHDTQPPKTPSVKRSTKVSKSAPLEVPLLELKKGKLVFKEKKLTLERHPTTCSELVQFYKFRDEQTVGIKSFPPEFFGLLAKLVQDCEGTINTVVNSVKKSLNAGVDDNKSHILPDDVLTNAIQEIAERKNYGTLSDGTAHPGLSIYRWEVRDRSLLGEFQEKIVERASVREGLSEQVEKLYADLSNDDKAKLQMPKSRRSKASTTPDELSVQLADSITPTGMADATLPSTSVKEDSEVVIVDGEPAQNAADTASKAEKSAQKNSSKKKKELKIDKAPAPPVISAGTKFGYSFEHILTYLLADDTASQFLERFPQFHIKTGVRVAKVNRFYHETPENFVDLIEKDGVATVVDGDVGDLINQQFKSFCKSGKKSIRASAKKSVNTISEEFLAMPFWANLRNVRFKLLQFAENYRPAYYGTCLKSSKRITGKNPFGLDSTHLNYEMDSEEEWEDPGSGDELKSDDEEDDDGDDAMEGDDEDDWLVPDGYLSADEAQEGGEEGMPDDLHDMLDVIRERPAKSKLGNEPVKRKELVPFISGPHIEYLNDTPFNATISMYKVDWICDESNLDPFEVVERADAEQAAVVPVKSRGKGLDDAQASLLATIVLGSTHSMMKLVELAKESIPTASKAAIEAKIREIAVKEKRAEDEVVPKKFGSIARRRVEAQILLLNGK
ncbi:hypothetical protein HDU76_003632 [Blyttiomyces sp. JEL0837]|nr:hypothetical protein HDU76_003632 [Blyttiomyces sp. JEL0837]